MEGHLKLWTGILGRWKQIYFILHDNILVYCKEKGDKAQGSIHLKISSITLIPDDPLRIIINSGTKELNIRATTIGEKIKWVNALRNSQEEAFKEIQQMPDLDIITEEDNILNNEEGKTIIKPVELKKIDDELAEIWCTKAYMDEALSLLAPHVQKNTALFDCLQKIQDLSHQLKVYLDFFIKSKNFLEIGYKFCEIY